MAITLPSRLTRPRAALPAEAWLLAGVAAAAAFGVAALYAHTAALVVAAGGCLAAAVALYEPRAIGPMLALALPLEISKLWLPFLQTRSELGGGLPPTSIIDAGRIVVALAFVVWVIRPGRGRSDVLPTSPLTLPLALLFAVYALSTVYAIDVAAARTEMFRLLFSLGGFALVPFFVRDRLSLRWTLFAFVAAAAALAIAGVYQQATGYFFWNPGLGLYGERRINATFADPNHFARFLLEGIVVAIALWFFVERRVRFGLLAPAIGLAVVTLVFTGSRGAWIVGAITLPIAVMTLPVAGAMRLRLLASGVALLVVAAVVLTAFSPFFSKRLNTFTFGVEASGARPYLVRAGLNMFADHPLTGVGAGGYQSSFENDYYRYKDPKIKANVTISHTSVVTIMAELGVVGLAALAFVASQWALYARTLIRRSTPELRATVIGIAIITAIIFLGSQSEGRFLEDPFLWFAAGLAVAIDGILAREREALPVVDRGADDAP